MFLVSYLLEYNRIYNILGIFFILALAVGMSHNRSRIQWRLVITALCLHGLLAFFVLKTVVGRGIIERIAGMFTLLYQAADKGIEFVFGNLSNLQGPWGFIFAIKVLPVIVFFGAFMSLLFYLRIVQSIVMGMNSLIRPLLGTTGPETLCAVANSFLGQTEAPLLIKHYLKAMTKSEFLVMMISGMGTISGSILAVFAVMGVPAVHLLAASVMAIPATILIAKIIYPETEESTAMVEATAEYEMHSGNVFDAISQGTSDGLWLALNVGAMLLSFLALLGMLNGFLYFVSSWIFSAVGSTMEPVTLNHIFSWICLPFAWFLGFGGTEATQVGQLIGTKIAVNELVAYSEMLKMNLSERTISIVTYALCGFSNFSCIGMQIGGIGSLVPEKRKWISSFGITAVFGAALANLLSAMVASLFL